MWLTLVPRLHVGMHFVTLRVITRCSSAYSTADAERPELHSHTERSSLYTSHEEPRRRGL
ncbi:hypothetical protein DA456_25065 [Pseudomonas syringae pv. atrofaciens]|uniref:Uncharacterized protein n=1 Tax=Pseudomonas syringae pv. atrofaciens TaxID=192087 RepID=A0AAD0ICE2_PSESX|nr:hypothetical protein DA456_25065 [Pseudomonas syringae pv. atrofaciens]UZA81457.1 hypothetical protein EZZ79_21775 [Pseudomonas syringae]